MSIGIAIVGVVTIGLVAPADGDDRSTYVLAHAASGLPLFALALACTWRARRDGPGEYSTFWSHWLGGLTTSTLASVAAVAAIVADIPALLAVDVALMVVGAPFWGSATLHMLRAQAGWRRVSVDLVDAATALLVLGAPGLLVVAEPVRGADELLFAVPFAAAVVVAPFGLYLTALNLARVPEGERAPQGIGMALAVAFSVSVTMQLAHVVGNLRLPLAVFVGGHVLVAGLLAALPLWAHGEAPRAAAPPVVSGARERNPMPYVSAAVLPLLGAFVFATRDDRSWGVGLFVAVVLVVVVLNAARHTAMSREARSLYAGLARMSEERRRLLASLLRALEDDRLRTASELHTQAVGSLATLGTIIQTASATLPADTAAAVTQTIAQLQADLGDRAEELRRLMVAMRPPPPVGSDRAGGSPGAPGPSGSPDSRGSSASPGRPGAAVGGAGGAEDSALAAALLAYVSELYCDRSAPALQVQVDPALRLDWTTTTIAYRIAQEALINAARHAGADTVEVRVTEHGGGILVEVRDDGVGFEPPGAPHGSGITTMEVFSQLGRGELTVRSAPGAGTVVRSVLGQRSSGPPPPPDDDLRPARRARHLRLIPTAGAGTSAGTGPAAGPGTGD